VVGKAHNLSPKSGVHNGQESEESEIKGEEGEQGKKSRPGAQENQSRGSEEAGQEGEISQGHREKIGIPEAEPGFSILSALRLEFLKHAGRRVRERQQLGWRPLVLRAAGDLSSALVTTSASH
jgi:hypothetical protein